jgi:hypothetical protein
MEKIAIDITDADDSWTIHKIGMDALNKALGEKGTKKFLKMCSGYGTGRDSVKRRRKFNKNITNEEIMAGIMKLQAENEEMMEAARKGEKIVYKKV